MRRWLAFAVTVCVVVAILAGCGDDSGGGPEDSTPVPTATVIPTPSEPVPVGDVVWALSLDENSGAPREPLTTLPNSAPRVFATVLAGELPPGTRLVAHWSVNASPLPELDPAPVVIESGRTDAWVSWSLAWSSEQPWPIATLGIEIEVNGTIMAQGQILIVRDRTSEGA